MSDETSAAVEAARYEDSIEGLWARLDVRGLARDTAQVRVRIEAAIRADERARYEALVKAATPLALPLAGYAYSWHMDKLRVALAALEGSGGGE